nr:MAG TPA: hypothetical protein [Caudoviricetes sp.]
MKNYLVRDACHSRSALMRSQRALASARHNWYGSMISSKRKLPSPLRNAAETKMTTVHTTNDKIT